MKRYIVMSAVVISFAGLSSTAWSGSDADIVKGKEELQGIRTEIKEKKERLRKAGRKERKILSDIRRIERRLKSLEVEAAALDREMIKIEKGLLEKESRISALGREIELKKELLRKRVVYLYRSGETGYLRFLLSSGSLSESGRRFKYLTKIAANDMVLINSYGADVEAISVQMEDIRADRERFLKTQHELAKKRDQISMEHDKRDRLLASVREEKLEYKRSLKDLEANARNLQALLDKLEVEASASSASPGAGSFPEQKGRLAMPVSGKLVGTFGKEFDVNTNTAVFRKGIEISAGMNAEIRAVHGGRVIFSDSFKGYGKMLIIDHGDGYYTLYAHASILLKKVNDEIKKGDIIAKVGDSGPYNEPTLYFEIRKGGKPVNPMDWLKS